MRTLLIAIGNPLRRDDGIAQAVLTAMAVPQGVDARALVQLVPEVAADLAAYGRIVFLDADALAPDVIIEPIQDCEFLKRDNHVSHPAEIVALARDLFGFSGEAFLCRLPAFDFSAGQGLSRRATRSAQRAAAALEHFIRRESDGDDPSCVTSGGVQPCAP